MIAATASLWFWLFRLIVGMALATGVVFALAFISIAPVWLLGWLIALVRWPFTGERPISLLEEWRATKASRAP